MKKTRLVLLAALLGTAALVPASRTEAACPNGDLICPDIYAPVICNDGVVYPNSCYAKRVCAHGCVPYNG